MFAQTGVDVVGHGHALDLSQQEAGISKTGNLAAKGLSVEIRKTRLVGRKRVRTRRAGRGSRIPFEPGLSTEFVRVVVLDPSEAGVEGGRLGPGVAVRRAADDLHTALSETGVRSEI